MKKQKKQWLEKLKAKWKSLSIKQKVIYCIIAVVLIGAIGSTAEESDTPKTTVETPTEEQTTNEVKEETVVAEVPEAEEVEAEPETPAFEELTFEEQVTQIANKVSDDRVKQVLIGNGELSIDIEMAENFTNKLMVSGMKSKAFSILEQLQEIIEGQGIDYISVYFVAPFIDKYGNEFEDNSGIFAISTEELMKVNFDNLTFSSIDNLCSTAWVHPAFTN